MIIFILPVIVFGAVLAYNTYEWGFEWSSFFISLLSAFLGLVGALLIVMIAACIPGPTKLVSTEVQPLYALEDGSQVSGRFFLGSGTIEGKIKYTYIYQTEDGGYKMDTVDPSQATLYYITDESECRIERENYVFKNPVHWFFGIGPLNNEYKIYIPEGSIIQNYNIDLQ